MQRFLDAYREFEEFARRFGMRVVVKPSVGSSSTSTDQTWPANATTTYPRDGFSQSYVPLASTVEPEPLFNCGTRRHDERQCFIDGRPTLSGPRRALPTARVAPPHVRSYARFHRPQKR